MNRQPFVSSLWNHRHLFSGVWIVLAAVLLVPKPARSQSVIQQPDSVTHQEQTPPLSVPERFDLPDLPLGPWDINKVSSCIRSATDFLFGKARASNINAFRKGPHPQTSRPARALNALKTWLEGSGCVSQAIVPLLSGKEPDAFVLRTTSPGQIPLSVTFYLIGQKSETIDYTIWLAPGPGLRHVDVTWENPSTR